MVRVTVTGLYRPVMTYGPLLADPGVPADGTVGVGASGRLASADFAAVTTARSDALRKTAVAGNAALRRESSLGGATTASASVPEALDRTDRSLFVSCSTLLIVALQLVLLAGCAWSGVQVGTDQGRGARGVEAGSVATFAMLHRAGRLQLPKACATG